MPGHALMFMQGCMNFAQMDVLDGQNLYSILFEFKETPPLNDNYDMFDIGDKNFIMNSGSYFLLLLAFILYNFLLWLINAYAVSRA